MLRIAPPHPNRQSLTHGPAAIRAPEDRLASSCAIQNTPIRHNPAPVRLKSSPQEPDAQYIDPTYDPTVPN